MRASEAAAQRAAENAAKEKEQLRLAALHHKEERKEVAQRLKVVEQQKQVSCHCFALLTIHDMQSSV